MIHKTAEIQYLGRTAARIFLAGLMALAVAACSSGVQRATDVGLQQPQFDDPGEQAGSLAVTISESAREDVADDLKFDKDKLDRMIRRGLEVNNLLAEDSDGQLPAIEVTVTSVRVRSTLSAVMLGFLAGDDHIDGEVAVVSPDGATLQQFGVSASYAFGGLAGGQDGSRLDWLYENFAERVSDELMGRTEDDHVKQEAESP